MRIEFAFRLHNGKRIGQAIQMLWMYLGEVLKRAFTPTPRLIDGLQIVAASALPALASFAGVEMPEGIQESALAYIGLAALSYFAIRLFWAPYAIWKDDKGEIGSLKLELSKPERMVQEHFSRLRAKSRMKLTKRLSQMHLACFDDDKEMALGNLAMHSYHAFRLAHSAGLPREFHDAIKCFDTLCDRRCNGEEVDKKDFQALDNLQRYLTGELTIGVLVRQLPKDTELETQQ